MALSDIAHLSIPFADLPSDIQDAIMWLNDRDDLRYDLGVPEDEGFPSFQDWKAMRRA